MLGPEWEPPYRPSPFKRAVMELGHGASLGIAPRATASPFARTYTAADFPVWKQEAHGLPYYHDQSLNDRKRLLETRPDEMVRILSITDPQQYAAEMGPLLEAARRGAQAIPASHRLVRETEGGEYEELLGPAWKPGEVKLVPVIDRKSGERVFASEEEIRRDRERYAPLPRSDAAPPGPMVAAKREADLRAALRRNALAEMGLQDVPFVGLVDIRTGRQAELPAETLERVNAAVDEQVQSARGEAPRPAPALPPAPRVSGAPVVRGRPSQEQVDSIAAVIESVTGKPASKDQLRKALTAAGFDLSR
jgi:hypothetical protein